MTTRLLSLPIVALDIIVDHLPVWKIRQLACMCHYMNRLQTRCFNRRRHLRLFFGTSFRKHMYQEDAQLYNFGSDFDLVIHFAAEIRFSVELPPSYVKLSPDWYVRNAEQIAKLVQWFPQIRHLTLVVEDCGPQDCQARLVSLWPRLNTFKYKNIGGFNPVWSQMAPKLIALKHLEHFSLRTTDSEVPAAKKFLKPLLESGQLKTLLCSDLVSCGFERNRYGDVVKMDRTVWDRPELALTVQQLETFGVSDYTPNRGAHFTNLRLLQKLKRLHVFECTSKHLRNWDFTDWTALRFLSFSFCDTKCSLRTILVQISPLPNLEQLYLGYMAAKIKLPSERACKSWPKLASVRRFQLKSSLDPCRFPFLAHSFPNTSEMSLKMTRQDLLGFSIDLQTDMSKVLKLFCAACSNTIQRGVHKFGIEDIDEFVWFFNETQTGGRELIPKVKLFTVEIDGKTRFSCDYHSID